MRYNSEKFEFTVGDKMQITGIKSCAFVPVGTESKEGLTKVDFLAFAFNTKKQGLFKYRICFHNNSLAKQFRLLNHLQRAAFGKLLAKDCEMTHLASKMENTEISAPFWVKITSISNGGHIGLWIGKDIPTDGNNKLVIDEEDTDEFPS